jgi:hypothetical protein
VRLRLTGLFGEEGQTGRVIFQFYDPVLSDASPGLPGVSQAPPFLGGVSDRAGFFIGGCYGK